MSQNVSTSSADEINLVEILRHLRRFFWGSRFYLLVGFVVGVALGLLYYYRTPPRYEASMVASSRYLTDTQVSSLIAELQLMLEYGADDQLADVLSLPLDTAEQISGLRVAIREKNIFSDREYREFTLYLTTGDQSIYPSVQSALLRYLNQSPFVQSRVRLEREGKRTMVLSLEQELRYLRGLQQSYARLLDRAIDGDGAEGGVTLPDISETSAKVVEIEKNILQARVDYKLLQQDDDVSVIKGFVEARKQKSPRRSKSLLFWTALSMFVAFGIYVAINRQRLLLTDGN
ncbi:MAG: hypothetical protein WBA12_02855 [Catalinimonas sp.]